MTDDEFFANVTALRDHASLRRQESLTAADVERFKEWDSFFGQLNWVLLGRNTTLHLRGIPGDCRYEPRPVGMLI